VDTTPAKTRCGVSFLQVAYDGGLPTMTAAAKHSSLDLDVEEESGTRDVKLPTADMNELLASRVRNQWSK